MRSQSTSLSFGDVGSVEEWEPPVPETVSKRVEPFYLRRVWRGHLGLNGEVDNVFTDAHCDHEVGPSKI